MTNEYLHLTASVAGVPQPTLQWYLDGVAVPGQTHRGLRVLVAGQFTELAGEPASGLAELDAEGRLVARDWPDSTPI